MITVNFFRHSHLLFKQRYFNAHRENNREKEKRLVA